VTLVPEDPTKIELLTIAIAPGFVRTDGAFSSTSAVDALICDMNAPL
jgi:hypothetical protein